MSACPCGSGLTYQSSAGFTWTISRCEGRQRTDGGGSAGVLWRGLPGRPQQQVQRRHPVARRALLLQVQDHLRGLRPADGESQGPARRGRDRAGAVSDISSQVNLLIKLLSTFVLSGSVWLVLMDLTFYSWKALLDLINKYLDDKKSTALNATDRQEPSREKLGRLL